MATAYSDNEDGVEDNTEEVLMKYYFYRGYQYNDILDLLVTYHNLEISERGLCTEDYGCLDYQGEIPNMMLTPSFTKLKVDGPDCIAGYRHVWTPTASLNCNIGNVVRRVI